MKLECYQYHQLSDQVKFDSSLDSENTLVLIFSGLPATQLSKPIGDIRKSYPKAIIMGASTAGEIRQNELFENSIQIAVCCFHSTRLKQVSLPIKAMKYSAETGEALAKQLLQSDLKSLFVLSDGLEVNGSQLTEGLASVLGSKVAVTGGLAADGDRFKETWVIVDNQAQSGYASAVGFYGKKLVFQHGSQGGWDRLGLERTVTRSENNVLFELDGQPALTIYKRYLGEKAKELPASGLLFPLNLKAPDSQQSKVRTILAVDEEKNSITFAGDIPQGARVTLMKANFDRLIDGASHAAEQITDIPQTKEAILSIAISCIGRKLVLKQRVEEELEATLEILPEKTQQIGFYSYGEISPLASGSCDLHNQTMTLTLISEQDA